jgi:hypothetical protein
MTLVQAQIPEEEYRLLRQRASNSGEPMKEVVRKAIHAYLADETIHPDDPIYRGFPLGSSRGKGFRPARDHDAELYGAVDP